MTTGKRVKKKPVRGSGPGDEMRCRRLDDYHPRRGVDDVIISFNQQAVIPSKIPNVDVKKFVSLIRRGVPEVEAEYIVMQKWRERWARACIAKVAGQLLARKVDPRLVYILVESWATKEFEVSAGTVFETVEWAAERELERRRGGAAHAV